VLLKKNHIFKNLPFKNGRFRFNGEMALPFLKSSMKILLLKTIAELGKSKKSRNIGGERTKIP